MRRLIDEIHLQRPFWGSRKIRKELQVLGFPVGRDQVTRLMREMGIEALSRKPKLSIPSPGHQKYPYLLNDLEIIRINQAWAIDITYIPMAAGFCYLVAILDLASRKVLSWRLSNTQDVSFCLDALDEAILNFGPPDIFNSDQGSQFTSDEFTDHLKAHGIRISMDGKGRWVDNVYVERLWRSVKYEEVYLKAYKSMTEAKSSLSEYFAFYNQKRYHQHLDYKTPDEVYWKTPPEKLVA